MRGALAFIALTLVMVSVWTMLRLPHRAQEPRSTVSPRATPRAEDAGSGAAGTAARETLPPEVEGAMIVVGRVVDERGRPVVDASVRVGSTAKLGIDAKGLVRVKAALVEARERPRVEATTDEDGRFRLDAPIRTEPLGLSVVADGFAPASITLPASGDEEVDAGAVTLVRGVILEGRVVDAGGAAIADARVTWAARSDEARKATRFASELGLDLTGMQDGVRRLAPGHVTTGPDGTFRLAHAQPGPFTVLATHDERPSNRIEGDAPEPGTHLRDLVIILEEGRPLEGQVLGVPSGAGPITAHARRVPERSLKAGLISGLIGFDPDDLPEMMVGLAAERSTRIDANASFVFRGLDRDDSYRVWATEEQGADLVPCVDAVDIGPGTEALDLVYEPGVQIAFRAVDGQDGSPVTRITVQIETSKRKSAFIHFSNPIRHEIESADGRFTLPPLRADSDPFAIDLRFAALGFQPLERLDVEIPRRGRFDLGALLLEPAPIVSVLVRDKATLTPIPDADVTLHVAAVEFPHARTSALGEVGRAEVTATANQQVCLEIEHADYAQVVDGPFVAPASGRVERTIDMSPGGTVHVLVLDPSGTPTAAEIHHRAPPDPVIHYGNDGWSQIVVSPDASESSVHESREADASGRATFVHLRPGTHQFRPANHVESTISISFGDDDKPHPDERWVPVEVADGTAVEVTLRQPPAGSIFGVVREDGTPIRDATVKFILGPAPNTASGRIEQQILSSLLLDLVDLSSDLPAVTTDRFGRYRLDRLPLGPHRLRISHADRPTRIDIEVDVIPGDHEFDVHLDTATITGRVLDESRAPIAAARVRLRRDAHTTSISVNLDAFGESSLDDVETLTDVDGTFELTGVPADVDFQLTAHADGHVQSVSDSFSVGARQARSIDLTLGRAGTIIVHAQGTTSQMVLAKPLDLPDDAPQDLRLGPLFAGHCEFTGLPPGRWRISIGETPNERSQEVLVTPGATIEITLQ